VPLFRNASEEFDEPERCAAAEAEVSDLVRTRGFRSNASAPGRGPAGPPASSRQPAKPMPAPISQHATGSRRRNAWSRCWPPPAWPTRRSANSFPCRTAPSEPTCTRSFPSPA